MAGLLEAVVALAEDLSLDAVLERVVESACRLLHARYGALGVIGDDRALSHFITVGIDGELARQIGPLPTGHGVLGLLISDPRPLRLHDLREHPEAYGFPEHHPPMQSFLGVPVRVRDVVFGNLYLTEKDGGERLHGRGRGPGRGPGGGCRRRHRECPALRRRPAPGTMAGGLHGRLRADAEHGPDYPPAAWTA